MRPSRELLKGVAELAVLAEIAAEPAHGYELARRLRTRSAGVLKLGEGTLYPLLTRLESAGAIEGHWETHDGRRRRVYKLTRSGRKRLAGGGAQWHDLVRGMDRVLGRPAHV